MKFAAIDIGSNAIRLLIEDVQYHDLELHIEKVSLTRVPVRLGEDVFSKGKISKEKTNQLIKTMKAFWYLMDVHNIEIFRACATSAMREAKNNTEVIEKIRKEANISIEILSGDEEAEIIFSNYLTQNLDSKRSYLYIDVGGGSTELTLIQKGKKVKGKSFELGAVRMLSVPENKEEWTRAKNWIEGVIKKNENTIAIGTGGNINTLFKIRGKKPDEVITCKELQEEYSNLKAMDYDERITELHLKPDRADVIIPACEIYLRLMEYSGIQEMIVPKIGLADGIILKLFSDWKKTGQKKYG